MLVKTYREVFNAAWYSELLRRVYDRLVAPLLLEVLEALGDTEAVRFAIRAHATRLLPNVLAECMVKALKEALPALLDYQVLATPLLGVGGDTKTYIVAFYARRGGWNIGQITKLIQQVYELGLIDVYRGMISRYGVEEPWLDPETWRLIVHYKGRVVDAALLGDGLLSIMQLYTGLVLARANPTVVLVEEPESTPAVHG